MPVGNGLRAVPEIWNGTEAVPYSLLMYSN
jgi:hypothetical protein